jgi:hypothetical protein
MSQTTTTRTSDHIAFDQLTIERKFLLFIVTSAACARLGMRKPPAQETVTAMAREAWDASGASTEILRDLTDYDLGDFMAYIQETAEVTPPHR